MLEDTNSLDGAHKLKEYYNDQVEIKKGIRWRKTYCPLAGVSLSLPEI